MDAAGLAGLALKPRPGMHRDAFLGTEPTGLFDQALDHARTTLQIHPGHIASIQQVARLEVLHPVATAGKTPDPAAREALRENLHEFAMRGESDAWKDWARLQLVKLDLGR